MDIVFNSSSNNMTVNDLYKFLSDMINEDKGEYTILADDGCLAFDGWAYVNERNKSIVIY